jgi:hypothetical protein
MLQSRFFIDFVPSWLNLATGEDLLEEGFVENQA